MLKQATLIKHRGSQNDSNKRRESWRGSLGRRLVQQGWGRDGGGQSGCVKMTWIHFICEWKCQRTDAFKTIPHFFLVLMNTDKSLAIMITNLFQASLRFSEWQEHSNFFFMFKHSYMSSMKYDSIPYKLTAKRVILPRPVQDQSSLHSAQMKWMISRPHPYWRGTLRAGSQGLTVYLRLVSNSSSYCLSLWSARIKSRRASPHRPPRPFNIVLRAVSILREFNFLSCHVWWSPHYSSSFPQPHISIFLLGCKVSFPKFSIIPKTFIFMIPVSLDTTEWGLWAYCLYEETKIKMDVI